MNLLLFDTQQLRRDGTITVDGRQHQHLVSVMRVQPGDTVRMGAIDGLMGSGDVLTIRSDSTILNVTLETKPPQPLPLKLILALPRPKMLRRILQTVASLGIKELHLINSYKVEKSFWQTPWLKDQAIKEQLLLGLEQCADTLMPSVYQHHRFKPFVEDQLADIIKGTQAIVAHPYTEAPCPVGTTGPVTLAIGPEGGFIPYEVEKLVTCQFKPVTLGPRILRVETALPVLVSRLCH